MTMTDDRKYFQAVCAKCDWLLVVPVWDANEYNYYLCHTCAMAKIGA